MYVCLCKGITDRHIREAVRQGSRSMRQLNQTLGLCSQCGRCGRCAKGVLDEATAQILDQHPTPLSVPIPATAAAA